MAPEALPPTRKEFLWAMAGAALLPYAMRAEGAGSKLLIVVAHPDDEYAFAAATYRLVRELGWTADQVVITNGEGGYRYSVLAEAVYGVALTNEKDGRAHLPSIRKEETLNAGKILGIRRHYFLDQQDSGFGANAAAADTSNWDRPHLLSFLSDLLVRERYDVVLTLLPTTETHAHHRAATLLALQAVAQLPEERRPLVFGAESHAKDEAPVEFAGLAELPLTKTEGAAPALVFDRTMPFGYHEALNYQVIANWVIAAHKSQGLFQMDAGRHQLEQFWLFDVSGHDAIGRMHGLQSDLCGPLHHTAAR